MPNRILRDWTASDKIDKLDVHAERFFTRLIMKVDDWGRYSANVKLLKSTLFPLRTDIRETDIPRWLDACEKSGLIALYTVASKDYLQINEFNQVLRQKVQKYPSPEECLADDKQMHSTRQADASLKGNEVETKPEEKEEGSSTVPAPALSKYTTEQIDSFKKFQEWILNNAPRVAKMKEPFTIDQYLSLPKKGLTPEDIRTKLGLMHNWAPLVKNNVSAYLTLLKWTKGQ